MTIKRKPTKTLSRFQPKKSEPDQNQEEKFWDTVYDKAQSLVVDVLKQAFPLSDQNLDLEKDSDWNDLFAEYEINYSQENFSGEVDGEAIAQEIAYEYLLLVVKSLLKNLSQFNCYDSDHFESLLEN